MRKSVLVLVVGLLLALFTAGVAHARPPDPLPAPCERPRPPAHCSADSPTGTLTGLERVPDGLRVTGTAQDPDAAGPVSISVLVDGTLAGTLVADGPGGAFAGLVPARAGNQVCAVAINRARGEDLHLGCRNLSVRVDPFGHLDAMPETDGGVRITGWAIDPDRTGPIDVDVTLDGAVVGTHAATADRPDVGAAFPDYGPAHGLDVLVPAVKGHPRVCLVAHNAGPGAAAEIGCRVARPGPPPAPDVPGRLAVATFNIIGEDSTAAAAGLGSFAQRLPDMAAAVAGFDVVGLQEVSSEEQVRRLAEAAGYPHYTVGVGVAGRPDAAIMSRSPLAGVQRIEGPKPGCVLGINCGGPVWILVAETVVQGKPLRVVVTHLSGDYQPQGLDRSEWRAAQARFIGDELVRRHPGRAVVLGDFNGNDDLTTGRGGPLVDAAPAAAYSVPGPDGQTHCDDRIDLILVTPPMSVRAYDGVYGGMSCSPLGVSDHPRVAAVLTVGADPVRLPPEDPPGPGPSRQVCDRKPWTPGC